jgi:GH24 family phage-related lysozyme (muramidase)
VKLSDKGAALIEEFEGFRAHAYRDAVGVPTIGFGSTKGVRMGDGPVTRAQARARLKREVDEVYGAAVNRLGVPLNQHQFDALCSFTYNLGPGAIASSTGIGRALRTRDWRRAADELLKWDKAGGRTLLGLTRRRRAERALFLRAVGPTLADWLTPVELRWIREYDDLKRRGADVSRRKVLRRVMTEQRRRIWRAAQDTGWERAHRRRRYASLLARTR